MWEPVKDGNGQTERGTVRRQLSKISPPTMTIQTCNASVGRGGCASVSRRSVGNNHEIIREKDRGSLEKCMEIHCKLNNSAHTEDDRNIAEAARKSVSVSQIKIGETTIELAGQSGTNCSCGWIMSHI